MTPRQGADMNRGSAARKTLRTPWGGEAEALLFHDRGQALLVNDGLEPKLVICSRQTPIVHYLARSRPHSAYPHKRITLGSVLGLRRK